jgi:hypothetical protein
MTDESRTSVRPYVQVAAICQTPMQEVTGYLSVIRIMDRVQIGGITDEMQPQPLNQLFIVIVLKSGEMKGKFKMTIVPETPSRKRLPGPELTILFEGEERGVATVLPVGIVAEEEGLYWFDVMLEGDLLTRIPLRVMYQKIQPGMAFPLPQPS